MQCFVEIDFEQRCVLCGFSRLRGMVGGGICDRKAVVCLTKVCELLRYFFSCFAGAVLICSVVFAYSMSNMFSVC